MWPSVLRYIAVALTFCTLSLPAVCSAARILGFFPVPAKSNLIVHCALANALAEAGHDVTVLANLPDPYEDARYKYVHMDVPYFEHDHISAMINDPPLLQRRFTAFGAHVMEKANRTLSHPLLTELLSLHSFDLLLLGYFWNDFHLGLAARLRCPVILLHPGQPMFKVNELIGNPSELAYVPSSVSGLQQPMGLWARVQNFVISLVEQYALSHIVYWQQQSFYRQHFDNPYPSLDEMIQNISLVFSNHHSLSQGSIRPNVPNFIEIGGIHIKPQPDTLPADVAEFLNSASTGIIYISFGSLVEGSNLSPEKAKMIFNVLVKLPFKAIWHWGDSEHPGWSRKILFKSWLPQADILAHPNVELFITHGGHNSIMEAQYHGVPMLGIPLFDDQHTNMARVERDGHGVSLEYDSLSEFALINGIEYVIYGYEFRVAANNSALLFRDRPQTARESVVYWVNYVLRHWGAPHMQSPAVQMASWQLLSLDVMALLAVVAVIVFSTVEDLWGWLYRSCCKKWVARSYRQSVARKQNVARRPISSDRPIDEKTIAGDEDVTKEQSGSDEETVTDELSTSEEQPTSDEETCTEEENATGNETTKSEENK